jgi:hypothetical protein
MPETDARGGFTSGAMSLSAMLLAALALLGIVRSPNSRPERQRASTPVPQDPAAPAAAAVAPSLPPDFELACKAYHPGDAEKLAILDPLRRYHSARLAQLPDETLAALARDPKRLIRWLMGGPGAVEVSSGEPVSFLVSIVPDPLISGSAFRYDHAITGLSLAVGSDRFLLDNFRIDHWLAHQGQAAPAKAESARSQAQPPGAGEAVEPDLRAPGCILFRRAPRPDDAGPNLLVVLLVAETPIRGVHAAMLHSSLDLTLEHARITRLPTAGTAAAEAPLVRIVGPNFSGSATSISRSLEAWLEANQPEIDESFPNASPVIKWINGVALSIDPVALEGSLTKRWPRAFQFRSVVYSSVDLNAELFKYLLANVLPGSGGNKIAYLTEESTGFGQQVRLQPRADTGTEVFKPFEMYFYSYPAHISEIRRRYTRQAGTTTAGAVELEPEEKLTFAFDEGADTPELVPIQSPAIISAYDELRLLEIAEDINRRGIRFAWLTATDIRDTLFVGEFLHRHCPNLQIVSINVDTAFLHDERIAQHRGTLFASSYPLWLESQDPAWYSDAATKPVDLRLRTFAEHPTIGTYNAMLAHLIERAAPLDPGQKSEITGKLQDAMVGYRWMHGSPPNGPPIWISVASQHGFLPLHLGLPGTPQHTPTPEGAVPRLPGSYRDHLWQPPSPRYLPRKAWTWDLSWRRWLNPTSGVSALVPILLGALSLFFVWLERRTERHLRRETGRSHSPLRRKPEDTADASGWLAAAIKADTELAAMRSSLRPTLTPNLGWWLVALAPFAYLVTRNPHAWLLFRPTLPGLLLFLASVGILIALTSGVWPRRVAFASAVGFWICGFLLTHLSSFEPYEVMRWGLLIALVSLFLIVLIRSIRLTLHWQAFENLTQTVQGLPLGSAFDRLPSRLTSRFGSFAEAILGPRDPELETRLDQVRQALTAEARDITADAATPGPTKDLAHRIASLSMPPAALPAAAPAARTWLFPTRPQLLNPTPDTGARMARGLLSILGPTWKRRDAQEAYGETSEEPKTGTSSNRSTDRAGADPGHCLIAQADQYVALALVRYLNRHLDILWRRVASLTIAALLLMAGVNSYPFQPAGRLFVWVMLVVMLAVAAVLFVLLGVNSNSLIARVNRLPAHRSVWNLDFLAKSFAFIAPVLGLLATLFFGMADVLRVFLGPFVR